MFIYILYPVRTCRIMLSHYVFTLIVPNNNITYRKTSYFITDKLKRLPYTLKHLQQTYYLHLRVIHRNRYIIVSVV